GADGRVRVGTDSGQPQVGQLQHGRDDFHRLLRRRAEPLEPDVDLDEHVAGPGGRFGVRARAVEVYESRNEPVSEGERGGLRQRVGIDEDRAGEPAPAQADAFRQVGDPQRVGAVRDEDASHLGSAVTVPVGLDHGEDLPLRAHELAHGAHVPGGGVEGDLENSRSGWTGHVGHGWAPRGKNTRMRRPGIAGGGRFVLTSGAMATEITPAVRSELAPTGKLRIGLNHGNFLLVTPGSSATEPRGVASDIGRELARRVGVPVEFIKFESAGKLGDSVRTGVWDVAFLGAEPLRAAEIAFTAAYLEIPSTYIVPAGSLIRSVDEVDREGVRIAVTEQSAYGLYLVRSVKRAKLVLTKTGDGAVQAFVNDKLEALAGLRPALLTEVQKLPGARVLDGQFTAVQQAVGTAKAREAAAQYLRGFVEDVKAAGLVAEAISRNGVQGVSVAPPAR